jgi:uncharacterized phage infection (PIP) family protein YhgE
MSILSRVLRISLVNEFLTHLFQIREEMDAEVYAPARLRQDGGNDGTSADTRTTSSDITEEEATMSADITEEEATMSADITEDEATLSADIPEEEASLRQRGGKKRKKQEKSQGWNSPKFA